MLGRLNILKGSSTRRTLCRSVLALSGFGLASLRVSWTGCIVPVASQAGTERPRARPGSKDDLHGGRAVLGDLLGQGDRCMNLGLGEPVDDLPLGVGQLTGVDQLRL